MLLKCIQFNQIPQTSVGQNLSSPSELDKSKRTVRTTVVIRSSWDCQDIILRCSACYLWRTATQVARVHMHNHTGVLLQVSCHETSLRELTQQSIQVCSTQLNTAQFSWAQLCIIQTAGRPVPLRVWGTLADCCIPRNVETLAWARRQAKASRTKSTTTVPLDCLLKSHIAPLPFSLESQHRCCFADTHILSRMILSFWGLCLRKRSTFWQYRKKGQKLNFKRYNWSKWWLGHGAPSMRPSSKGCSYRLRDGVQYLYKEYAISHQACGVLTIKLVKY